MTTENRNRSAGHVRIPQTANVVASTSGQQVKHLAQIEAIAAHHDLERVGLLHALQVEGQHTAVVACGTGNYTLILRNVLQP